MWAGLRKAMRDGEGSQEQKATPTPGDVPGGPVAWTQSSQHSGPGSIPGWETRSHMLQPRWRIPSAATNTLHIKKKKKLLPFHTWKDGGRGQNWGRRRGRFTGWAWGVYSHREEQPLGDPL